MSSVQKDKERLISFYSSQSQNSSNINLISQGQPRRFGTIEVSNIIPRENDQNQNNGNQNPSQEVSQVSINNQQCKNQQIQGDSDLLNQNRNQPSNLLNLQKLENVQNVNEIIKYWPYVIQYLNSLQIRIDELQSLLNKSKRN
ncbi:hypothetical protein ABPG72_000469 [Tetrahymena utriculariae]